MKLNVSNVQMEASIIVSQSWNNFNPENFKTLPHYLEENYIFGHKAGRRDKV